MIIMGMRNENKMQILNIFRFDGKADYPPGDFDAAGEIGIGQDGCSGKIDKYGGVPHPAGKDFMALGISRERHS